MTVMGAAFAAGAMKIEDVTTKSAASPIPVVRVGMSALTMSAPD